MTHGGASALSEIAPRHTEGVAGDSVRLTLLAPAPLVVGKANAAMVRLTLTEPLELRALTATIDVVASVGRGPAAVVHDHGRQDVTLLGVRRTDLPTIELPLRIDVPASAPPTHEASGSWSRVRVAIVLEAAGLRRMCWWFTLSSSEPSVASAPRAQIARSRDDRISLSVADEVARVGETLAVNLAIRDLRPGGERTAALVLETQVRGDRDALPLARVTRRLTVPLDGTQTTCAFEIPVDAVPSFDRPGHVVTHTLGVQHGREPLAASIPLTIVDDRARGATPSPSPPALDGASLVLAAAAAARFAFDDHAARPTLVRTDGLIAARIELGPDADARRVVLATPPLGVGLRVRGGGVLRHLLWRDVEIGVPAWDRAYHVVAAHPDRARPLLRAVAEAMRTAPAMRAIAHWHDDELALEPAPHLARDVDGLHAVAEVQRVLAAAIDALPAPTDVALEPAAWDALALALGGRFTPGLVCVDGAVGGYLVRTTLHRDDHGGAGPVTIEVRAARPSLGALAHVWTGDGDAVPSNIAAALGAGSAPVALHRIVDGVVTARLALTARDAAGRPVLDAAQARAAIDAVVSVRASLDAAAPYR